MSFHNVHSVYANCLSRLLTRQVLRIFFANYYDIDDTKQI